MKESPYNGYVPFIDISRQFAGEARLVELVRYVEASVPDNESEWLEWKSRLDMSKKEACFAVAKGVLGFLNRHPDVASRFAGGFAYFVVGAEAGSITGQDPIDNDIVVKKVTPFIGTVPSWRPNWVVVDGKSVLVIEVDPPKWGDRLHPLQKQFKDEGSGRTFTAGQLFVRRSGGSHPVNPSELQMLEERFVLRPWRVTVRHIGEAPMRLSASDRAIQEYVENERRRLIAPVEEEERRTRAATAPKSALATFDINPALPSLVAAVKGLQKEETRTPQQYRDQLSAYVAELQGSLRRAASARLAKNDRADVRLVIENLVDDNLEDVRLELVISGDVFVAGYISQDECELPSPPRIWGAYFPGPGFSGLIAPASLPLGILSSVPPTPRPCITRSGEATYVVFPPVSLRPKRQAQVAMLSIVGFGDDEILTVSWSATTTNKSGDYSGELLIRLGNAVTLDKALASSEE